MSEHTVMDLRERLEALERAVDDLKKAAHYHERVPPYMPVRPPGEPGARAANYWEDVEGALDVISREEQTR
jgi:hypothetical protein